MATAALTQTTRLAQRMRNLGTETAFEVLAKARELESQGRSIIHLEIGEPDFDTPAHIIDEAVQALRTGATHYGPAAGLPNYDRLPCTSDGKILDIVVRPRSIITLFESTHYIFNM